MQKILFLSLIFIAISIRGMEMKRHNSEYQEVAQNFFTFCKETQQIYYNHQYDCLQSRKILICTEILPLLKEPSYLSILESAIEKKLLNQSSIYKLFNGVLNNWPDRHDLLHLLVNAGVCYTNRILWKNLLDQDQYKVINFFKKIRPHLYLGLALRSKLMMLHGHHLLCFRH